MTDRPQVLYELTGAERSNLQDQFRALVRAQDAFWAIVSFIARRENINLQEALFDQEGMRFLQVPLQRPQLVADEPRKE